MLNTLILSILLSLLIIIGLLLSVAFLTLIERKIIASTQNRRGPNVVGFSGLLQPFADALKLIIKESIFPRNSNLIIFIISPLISLFFAISAWAFIPFSYSSILVDSNIALLFIFTSSILHIYGIILAGWSSGSRYSFLGSLRSTAQLIAYDISIAIIMCTLALFPKSLNLIDIIEFQDCNGYFAFYLPILFLLFLVSSLAETNRHPFDLPEAESELVGGFNTEYSSSYFAFFFSWICFNFVNGIPNKSSFSWRMNYHILFSKFFNYLLYFKIIIYILFFLLIRAAIPRYRYDQLMRLGWKFVLPASLSFFFLTVISVTFFLN